MRKAQESKWCSLDVQTYKTYRFKWTQVQINTLWQHSFEPSFWVFIKVDADRALYWILFIWTLSIGTQLIDQDGRKFEWMLSERWFGYCLTRHPFIIYLDVHPALINIKKIYKKILKKGSNDLAAEHYPSHLKKCFKSYCTEKTFSVV